MPPISLNITHIAENILEQNQKKYFIKWMSKSDNENTWEYLQCPKFISQLMEADGSIQNFEDIIFSERSEHCWYCKEENDYYEYIDCSKCNRTFHTKCVKVKSLSPGAVAKWQCSTCNDLTDAEESNRSKNLDMMKLNDLLKLVLERCLEDDNIQMFRFPVCKTVTQVLVNPISLFAIQSKIKRCEYKSSEEFFADLQWIYHNCLIYYPDNLELYKAVRWLLTFARNELDSSQICADCYVNAIKKPQTFFTDVCANPHLIVWAKMKKFPHWPAKLMSINGKTANVRFFEEHTNANVSVADCYLYSEKHPMGCSITNDDRLKIAVEETETYIRNIIDKFDQFNYAPLKRPLLSESLQAHLAFQVPIMDQKNDSIIPKRLSARRRSVFTIASLRRKSISDSTSSEKIAKRRPTLQTVTNVNASKSPSKVSSHIGKINRPQATVKHASNAIFSNENSIKNLPPIPKRKQSMSDVQSSPAKHLKLIEFMVPPKPTVLNRLPSLDSIPGSPSNGIHTNIIHPIPDEERHSDPRLHSRLPSIVYQERRASICLSHSPISNGHKSHVNGQMAKSPQFGTNGSMAEPNHKKIAQIFMQTVVQTVNQELQKLVTNLIDSNKSDLNALAVAHKTEMENMQKNYEDQLDIYKFRYSQLKKKLKEMTEYRRK